MTNIRGSSKRWPRIPNSVRSFPAPAGCAKCDGVAGRGKRGGLRIIYFLRTRHGQIWMLTLYAKNVAENIPAHVLRQIKDEIDG